MGLSHDEVLARRKIIRNKIIQNFNKASVDSFIFSAEDLCHWKEKDLLSFKKFLEDQNCRFLCVGYVRSPKSFMESVFQEQLKAGILNKADLPLKTITIYPHYQWRFEKFGKVFGWDNVRFWLFNSENFHNGCVVQDFCSRLKIPLYKNNIIRRNQSLSKEAISLLYAYCLYGNNYDLSKLTMKEKHKIAYKLYNLRGDKFYFSSSLIKPILSHHQKDIIWMEEKLGFSLKEDLVIHDNTAIKGEKELLKFSPKATYWLAEQLGIKYVKSWHDSMDIEQVANWMHLLRVKLLNH